MTTSIDFSEISYNKILPLETLLEKKNINQFTYEKVILAKKYIERKYNLIKIRKIENEVIKEKLNNTNIPKEKKEEILNEIEKKEKNRLKKIREKLTIFDYESLAIIGRGAFGEVHVCRNKKTKEIVAIKKIKKSVLLQKNQIKHTRDEQDFLSKIKSEWIVELKYSFQEGDFLYLIMEYLPGGDLMNLFIKKDTLTEEEAKFYICEIILAIESIHNLNCIHRDIKPDNILIDKTGHIKLSDFGLAKIADNIFKEDIINYKGKKHNRNFSCVGTAYYVAPEVLNKKGYGKEIDWWSLGIIFYEMIFGYAPFCSKQTNDVCYKVMHFEKFLKFPESIKISDNAKDLIIKLITNSNSRLGKNGSEEIKSHPFFKGINWNKIKEMRPPFIPKLKNDHDIKYFEIFESNDDFYPDINNKKRKDAEYIGYTYKGEDENNIDLISIIEKIQKTQIEYLKNNGNKKEINNSINDETIENDDFNKKNSHEISNGMKEDKFDKFISERKKVNKKIIIENDSNNGDENIKKLTVIPIPKKSINIKDAKSKSPNQNKVVGKISLKNSISAKIMRIFSKSKSKSKDKDKE